MTDLKPIKLNIYGLKNAQCLILTYLESWILQIGPLHSGPEWNRFVQKTNYDRIYQICPNLTVFVSSFHGEIISIVFRPISIKIRAWHPAKGREKSWFWKKWPFLLSINNHIMYNGHSMRKFAHSFPISLILPWSLVTSHVQILLYEVVRNFAAKLLSEKDWFL